LLARLDDSEVYLEAAETGVGIFEMDPVASEAEREQFLPIAEWVDRQQQPQGPRVDDNVVSLRSRSAQAVVFLK
jgi:hypothetical protein